METTAAAPRQCLTCGEFEGTPWVTAKCLFEQAAPAAAYEPVVQEFPHGYYGGTRRMNATRATAICRHQHKTRQGAERCAERQTAERNTRPA